MFRVVNQLEREIHGITSKDLTQFTKELSIWLGDFDAWWQAIGIQELRKTFEQCVIHLGYPTMDCVTHPSE